jgi:hypothetical protein
MHPIDPRAQRCPAPLPDACDAAGRTSSCDGPHSGIPDDQRPPHWRDLWYAGLAWAAPARDLADAWAGYGFTAADLAAWAAVGITEPTVAAECRTVGFNPRAGADRLFLASSADPTDRDFSSWAERLESGDASAEEAMAAFLEAR